MQLLFHGFETLFVHEGPLLVLDRFFLFTLATWKYHRSKIPLEMVNICHTISCYFFKKGSKRLHETETPNKEPYKNNNKILKQPWKQGRLSRSWGLSLTFSHRLWANFQSIREMESIRTAKAVWLINLESNLREKKKCLHSKLSTDLNQLPL